MNLYYSPYYDQLYYLYQGKVYICQVKGTQADDDRMLAYKKTRWYKTQWTAADLNHYMILDGKIRFEFIGEI